LEPEIMTQSPSFARMALVLLALIGFFDATYLALERLIPSSMLCPTGGGCEIVAASEYSVLLGVLPVAYLGVIGYCFLFGLGMAWLYREQLLGIPLVKLILPFSAFGLGFSGYLVALQLFVIQAICFWCMLSALIQLVIFGIILFEWHTLRTKGVDSSPSLAL
jgi:uncharacterized membrane protein